MLNQFDPDNPIHQNSHAPSDIVQNHNLLVELTLKIQDKLTQNTALLGTLAETINLLKQSIATLQHNHANLQEQHNDLRRKTTDLKARQDDATEPVPEKPVLQQRKGIHLHSVEGRVQKH